MRVGIAVHAHGCGKRTDVGMPTTAHIVICALRLLGCNSLTQLLPSANLHKGRALFRMPSRTVEKSTNLPSPALPKPHHSEGRGLCIILFLYKAVLKNNCFSIIVQEARVDLAAGRGDACSLDRKRSVDTAPSCDAVSGRRPATALLGAREMQCTTVTQQWDETAMSGMGPGVGRLFRGLGQVPVRQRGTAAHQRSQKKLNRGIFWCQFNARRGADVLGFRGSRPAGPADPSGTLPIAGMATNCICLM